VIRFRIEAAKNQVAKQTAESIVIAKALRQTENTVQNGSCSSATSAMFNAL
jgi:hypothetical protein